MFSCSDVQEWKGREGEGRKENYLIIVINTNYEYMNIIPVERERGQAMEEAWKQPRPCDVWTTRYVCSRISTSFLGSLP